MSVSVYDAELLKGPRWRLEMFIKEHYYYESESSGSNRGDKERDPQRMVSVFKKALFRAMGSIEKFQERQDKLVQLARERGTRLAGMVVQRDDAAKDGWKYNPTPDEWEWWTRVKGDKGVWQLASAHTPAATDTAEATPPSRAATTRS
ncbi:unnamed protein product [Vitrella brassicaformis CCMP3155]|uniref:Uncharacterized protein n=1 Tax=Vitrella brassicaformis (strain CCMP3155) TaxID=1169540 RepID=A0A0G4ELA3_VITBC|nr:unnamed protein product [Vitrella brassicaformis CCMP3155]|eukprot:CEL97339.1 unnamed protein product [Vitrella brassicaformis CCMP3155]